MSVAYDPLDTLRWMLEEARAAVLTDSVTDEGGRLKRKTKARREAEQSRYEVLREALWNVAGRPVPLERMGDEILLAA